MKRFLVGLILFPCLTMQAKLRIRQEHPQWAERHYRCCVDRRGQIVPYGVTNAEDAVNALREQIIKEYDAGEYQADWGKKRRAILELQAGLGYTVPEDYDFNEDD